VVHAIDAVLVEHLGHAVVDRRRAGQVLADRLFQHHPGACVGGAVCTECVARRHVEARRGAQVVEHVAVAQVGHPGRERLHGGRVVDAGGGVVQPFQQAAKGGVVAFDGRDAFVDRIGDQVGEGLAVEVAARAAEDAQAGRQQVLRLQAVQRGQQHALREVAGGAEDGQQGSGRGSRHAGGPDVGMSGL